MATKSKKGSTQQKVDQMLEERFNNLVPSMGNCETIQGECIRAMMKLAYRWYNDGDMYHIGYGCETAGPSQAYLYDKFPGNNNEIQDMWHDIEKINHFGPRADQNDAQYQTLLYDVLWYILNWMDEVMPDPIPNSDNEDCIKYPSRFIDEDDDICCECYYHLDGCQC